MRFHGLNREIDVALTWRQTEIMRGVSIVLIMLHNLFHIYPTIIHECEFIYSPGLTGMFFDKLSHPDGLLVYHVLSFLGWFGVPAFIFLSGYGLTRRYDSGLLKEGVSEIPSNGSGGACSSGSAERAALRRADRASFNPVGFIKRNWLKLFQLMLLGVAIFFFDQIINDVIEGEGIKWGALARILIPLTELNDLVQYWAGTIPGVYWYFGLAFEFYVFYAFCVQGRRQRWMWIFTAVCFLAFFYFRKHPLFGTETVKFEAYYRHNFVGWMLPFACGVALGRLRRIPLWAAISILLASFVLFIPSQACLYTWQFAAIWAIGIILTISLLFAKIPYWSGLWGWIGRLSAYIFVAHPIVRHLGRFIIGSRPNPEYPVPDLALTLCYIALTFLLAILYRWLTSLIFPKKVNNK